MINIYSWNSLPATLATAPSLNVFKSGVCELKQTNLTESVQRGKIKDQILAEPCYATRKKKNKNLSKFFSPHIFFFFAILLKVDEDSLIGCESLPFISGVLFNTHCRCQ